MNAPLDHRMLWLRLLDPADEGNDEFVVEAEVGSELLIPGRLVYGPKEQITFGSTTREPDGNGLYKYCLRLLLRAGRGHDPGTLSRRFEEKQASKGYFVRGAVVGELLSLFSLCLEARFFLIATNDRAFQLPMRQEYPVLRGRAGPAVDGRVFVHNDERNLTSSLIPFLNLLEQLPVDRHLEVAMAAEHYALAVRAVGLDEEMVFVRLVSAVERLAHDHRIARDLFPGVQLKDLLKLESLSEEQVQELTTTFNVRKAKARFVGFLEKHSAGFFDGRPEQPAHVHLTRENIGAVSGAIYNARSGNLHSGNPMYLSPPIPGTDWDMDPSAGRLMQDRLLTERERLPRVEVFHRIVRHVILDRIRGLAMATHAS